MPYFDAKSRACPWVGDITASSSACGTMRRASAWIVEMNWEPTRPTRILSRSAMSADLRAAIQLSLDAAHAREARDAAARAELNATMERSAFQPCEQESGIETVARARRVHDASFFDRCAGELESIPRRAVECHGSTRSPLDHRELHLLGQPPAGVLDVVHAGDTQGFLFIGHEHVHVTEDFAHGLPVTRGGPVGIE